MRILIKTNFDFKSYFEQYPKTPNPYRDFYEKSNLVFFYSKIEIKEKFLNNKVPQNTIFLSKFLVKIFDLGPKNYIKAFYCFFLSLRSEKKLHIVLFYDKLHFILIMNSFKTKFFPAFSFLQLIRIKPFSFR